MTPARPDLKFASLDALVADADHLRAGYAKAGQWDLGMVLDHLAKAMSIPFAGGRSLPWPAGPIGRALVRRMVRKGRYPSVKLPAPPSQRPTPGVDVNDAYHRFVEAADRLKATTGTVVSFAPIGWVPTGDFVAVQLIHGAHHLAFLRPTAEV